MQYHVRIKQQFKSSRMNVSFFSMYIHSYYEYSHNYSLIFGASTLTFTAFYNTIFSINFLDLRATTTIFTSSCAYLYNKNMKNDSRNILNKDMKINNCEIEVNCVQDRHIKSMDGK